MQTTVEGQVNCRNCDAVLTGPYCAQCGQKNALHRPTFGHFFAEGVESLTHADSRLWRTLWMLMSKPGVLTREFFAGRREHYLPPIRLYIVLSVIFFVGVAFEPGPVEPTSVASEGSFDADCNKIMYDGPYRDFVHEKLRNACVRAKQGDIGDLAKAFVANVPKAMWVLLPFFAVFMLLFWWRPRRLYAEHLLFLIHNHSALFAGLIIDGLASLVLPGYISGWLTFLILLYLVWYNWRGMRVFYDDSRGLAVFKFIFLSFLYLVCALMVLTLTGFAAVLSI